eukprot:scaffold90135_cov69-Phaeocystis_antarctica.AAC.2
MVRGLATVKSEPVSCHKVPSWRASMTVPVTTVDACASSRFSMSYIGRLPLPASVSGNLVAVADTHPVGTLSDFGGTAHLTLPSRRLPSTWYVGQVAEPGASRTDPLAPQQPDRAYHSRA